MVPKNFGNVHCQLLQLRYTVNQLDQVENFLKDEYGEYEFYDETYGNLFSILNEMDFFDFKKPNYDYINANITKEILNDETQNRLEWG